MQRRRGHLAARLRYGILQSKDIRIQLIVTALVEGAFKRDVIRCCGRRAAGQISLALHDERTVFRVQRTAGLGERAVDRSIRFNASGKIHIVHSRNHLGAVATRRPSYFVAGKHRVRSIYGVLNEVSRKFAGLDLSFRLGYVAIDVRT